VLAKKCAGLPSGRQAENRAGRTIGDLS